MGAEEASERERRDVGDSRRRKSAWRVEGGGRWRVACNNVSVHCKYQLATRLCHAHPSDLLSALLSISPTRMARPVFEAVLSACSLLQWNGVGCWNSGREDKAVSMRRDTIDFHLSRQWYRGYTR